MTLLFSVSGVPRNDIPAIASLEFALLAAADLNDPAVP